MKNIQAVILVISIFILINGFNGADLRAAKKYDLKYDMDKKSAFTVTATTKHRNQRDVMGNVLVDNTVDIAGYKFYVRSSTDGGMALDMEYVNRSHETDNEQYPAGPDFSGLIGKSVKLFLAPDGDTSEFEGFENLPPVEIVDTQMTLEKEQYISPLKNLFPPLPDEMVEIGESWSGEKEYLEHVGDAIIPVKIGYDYTLAEKTQKDGVECLKITGSYTVNLEGEFTTGGMDLTLKLEGKGTETAYFALKKGMLLSAENSSIIEGSAGNEDLGISIPMKHNNDHTITVSFD